MLNLETTQSSTHDMLSNSGPTKAVDGNLDSSVVTGKFLGRNQNDLNRQANRPRCNKELFVFIPSKERII